MSAVNHLAHTCPKIKPEEYLAPDYPDMKTGAIPVNPIKEKCSFCGQAVKDMDSGQRISDNAQRYIEGRK